MERLSLSGCSRSGRCQHGGGGTQRTLPPRLPRGNAPVAHMVLKGVSASNNTHPHNKETRHSRPPPLSAPRRHSGTGAPSASQLPPEIAARELSLVGAGARGTGAGANPAGQQAASELGGARRARGDTASTEI